MADRQPNTKPPSVAWLYTSLDECALDSVAFSQIEPEIEQAIWDVVGDRVDGPPQGLQAAVEVLGEQWRQKHLPQHENNPSLLLPPYLSAMERAALLDDVRTSVTGAMDKLALHHGEEDGALARYGLRVEEIMRHRFVQQLAVEFDQRGSRSELDAAATNTIGAALAQLWRDQPRLHAEHVPLLRGHALPPPLRAHDAFPLRPAERTHGRTAARAHPSARPHPYQRLRR